MQVSPSATPRESFLNSRRLVLSASKDWRGHLHLRQVQVSAESILTLRKPW